MMVYTIRSEACFVKTIKINLQSIPNLNEPISICLGYFDGVHKGHQKLIADARAKSSYPVAVLLYDFSDTTSIFPHKNPYILTSLEDKEILFRQLGIDYLFILNNLNGFFDYSSEDFMSKVLDKLNVKEVFVGEDYRFGKNALGNPAILKTRYKVEVIPLLIKNNLKISTQEIINLIKEGNISQANDLLGHDYQISGIVSNGKKLGSTIGFPTANLQINHPYVIPKFGVYKTISFISGIPHISITNVGVNPTINANNQVTIESHLLNYSGDFYGKRSDLAFISYIRDEKKFNSIDELKAQIAKDIEAIK